MCVCNIYIHVYFTATPSVLGGGDVLLFTSKTSYSLYSIAPLKGVGYYVQVCNSINFLPVSYLIITL